ncbi:hypothetical protein AALP_AA1G026300 [Arabis alpina]|uniref:Cullin family profile domain-containing protein n=1 Tax=Arabis alpina TaxID=50452 RepID=A0A087HKN1_ARAAL|nr:hypothetical protein AALP_AA1G026300 [Arabis alpina]
MTSSPIIFSFLLLFIFSFSSSTSFAESPFRPRALILPVSKDKSTLQYTTVINQRTPLVSASVVFDLGGRNLWVECDKDYVSTTYNSPRCNSAVCSRAGPRGCGQCFSPLRPGCNNNTCNSFPDNTVTGTITSGEIALDVVSIQSINGSKPGRVVKIPNFIFVCGSTFLLNRLASGTVGMAGIGRHNIGLPSQFATAFNFNRKKFAVCLTSGRGVAFFGDVTYNFLPGIEISPLTTTPLLINPVSTASAYTQGEKSAEYFIGVRDIKISDESVPFNKSLLKINGASGYGGTKLSTVDAYTVLETSIYNAFTSAFIRAATARNISQVSSVKPFGACFSTANVGSTRIGYAVPDIQLVLHSKDVVWRIFGANSMKPPHDYAHQLYYRYCQLIEDYAKQTVLPSLKDKYDEYMLKELVKRWSNHKVMVKWLTFFFNYLDRFLVSRRALPTLNEVGLACLPYQVYRDPEMRSKAKDVVLTLIHKEREGEQIDRALLKNVLDIFVENGVGKSEKYEEGFEIFILEDTASYYSRKASSWIQDDSFPEYMLKTEECLKKERERVTHYLYSSTEPKLVKIVLKELSVVVAKQLQENEHLGFQALLRDDKMDDLSRMYRIYHPIPQWLKLVADLFNKHVTAEGNILIKQVEDADTTQAANTGGVQEQEVRLQVLMRIVNELRNKYMVYVTECFQNNYLFHKALQEAFEIFCSKKVAGISIAELLATLCDNLLKKGGNEKLSDEAIEARLENLVEFLVYISDKDLFAELYSKKLARRLLFDRSGNDEHERSVLRKLKEQFGGQFISKMEGMVTDMTLAKENQKSFQEYITSDVTENAGTDLTVTVLTSGFWPSYKTCDLKLPSEMAAMLLLFNNTERLSYTDILEQLNLSHEDLVMLLHSLSCAKYKILKKEPNSSSISQTDVFEFNSKFTNRMQRIKIPLPKLDERKKVVEDVDRDRRYAIDASLVRIMKSRKVLDHQQLVSECVEHNSRMFKPDIMMIKKRIEELINRDYLERDNENRSILKYVA